MGSQGPVSMPVALQFLRVLFRGNWALPMVPIDFTRLPKFWAPVRACRPLGSRATTLVGVEPYLL